MNEFLSLGSLLVILASVPATGGPRATSAPRSTSGAVGIAAANNPHNLSATGTGAYATDRTDQTCVFCHTPHRAGGDVPMWNRKKDDSGFIMYAAPSPEEGSSI